MTLTRSCLLASIYEAVGTTPAKFTASAQWLRKFEEEEKEKKLAELKARYAILIH